MTERLRIEALSSLLMFDRSLDQIRGRLMEFPWDSNCELVVLATTHVQSVLRRYVAHELTSLDLENWANAVESREDIGFEAGKEELLKRIIFELANPVLNVAITPELATEFLADLTISS
ncbi:MAG TPA: hypothetical protein VL175_21055 [Pirellulales bacterium]|nr:hypothetical protein [Pirellulales bacterium]